MWDKLNDIPIKIEHNYMFVVMVTAGFLWGISNCKYCRNT